MDEREPPTLELRPTEVRRVEKYPRRLIWLYGLPCALFGVGLALASNDWNVGHVLTIGAPFILLGVWIGILGKDRH